MKLKIMVITSEYLKNYFISNLNYVNELYDIEIKVYKDFEHISKIYNEYVNYFDGFLISGNIAKTAIFKGKIDVIKPVVSINLNLQDIYKAIIDLMIKNRNIDLNRVLFDFLIPVKKEISVDAFLNKSIETTISKDIEEFVSDADFNKIISLEDNLKREILQFWELKIFDVLICQFSNIIPILEENKIPYIFPLPSKENLQDTLKNLVNMIKLKHVKGNFPAIIRVDFKNDELDKENILKTLKKLFSNECIEYNLDNEKDHLKFLVTSSSISKLTDNYKTSKISKILSDEFGKNLVVSYAVGNNFSNSLKHSEIAMKESLLKDKCFIVDENENLIGPLDSENYVIVSKSIDEKIFEIARKSNLSTNTIQKIDAILKSKKSKKITSIELSKYLGSTTRNANRILQSLVNNELASIVQENSTNTKGRPTKVYEIRF